MNPDEPAADSPKVNPLDYMSRTEWYGNATTPAGKWMAEHDEVTFEAALAEAKAEGNMSRANIARKMGWTSPELRRTRRNKPAADRGYEAMLRLLNEVSADELSAWLAGAQAAIEDSRP